MMTEDEYRERARKLIAAHQPANQVAHLLIEEGASEPMATQIAYAAKIQAFRMRRQLSISAAALPGVIFVAIMIIRPYIFGNLVVSLLIPCLAGLLDAFYCTRQIHLARTHLAS